jgi:hypothetical protein
MLGEAEQKSRAQKIAERKASRAKQGELIKKKFDIFCKRPA